MTQSLVIVFPIYPGVTHLDFTGPHQFLARLPGAQVIVASLGGQAVAAEGFVFAGLSKLEEISRADVICVPGGFGCVEAMLDAGYMAEIRRLASDARYITSVCTGSLILGAAGLLKGRRAACHWAWRELLSDFGAYPDAARVVRDGNLLTGGGVTAGIDFAITLAAELAGPLVAQSIQLALEYAPAPPFDAGRPETAPAEVVERIRAINAAALPARRAAVAEAVARL